MQMTANIVAPCIGASAVAHLRQATRALHERVDAAFSRFDLADRGGYAGFLIAHAQATTAAERVLSGAENLPPWRPRTHLLVEDLDKLGSCAPAPMAFAAHEAEAWQWGVLYVLEGSRLGGSVLARRIYAGAPSAFCRRSISLANGAICCNRSISAPPARG